MSDNPYLRDESGRKVVTGEGREYLARTVTDTSGNVYAFRSDADPVLAAAAMARLSRRGSDMREIILDEFAPAGPDKVTALLQRVVTAYGDDSVQQLVGVQLVVEKASNWLTKQLEWGRLASYLEQSTRYIFFDEPDENGNYRFHTPSDLQPELKDLYRQTMTQIFERYSQMVRELTEYVRKRQPEPENKTERVAWLGATRAQACDAIRPVLPVATTSTVGIFGSAQAIDNLIMHLLSLPQPEAREVGQMIYDQAVKVIPAFLERTMREDRGLASVAYRANTRAGVRELAQDLIGPTACGQYRAAVKLVSHSPRDEKMLVAEMLFAHSNLCMRDLYNQVTGWPDEKLEAVMRAYFGERLNRRHRPGRALEIAHFEWEVVGDYGTFRDLQRHRIVDAFEWQDLTPDYGYEVPQLVVDAGLEQQFGECFALSEMLYGTLKDAGEHHSAQYATLLGHRMRYRFMANARELFHLIELRTQPAGHPGYRKICQEMYDLFAQAYPITASAMRFVNQNEDEALTRMAAELATQYKLDKLT